jgi:hypothetical protein
MSRSAVLVLALAVTGGSTLFSACSACVADDHAQAQSGGAPRPTPITGVNCFSLAERRTRLTTIQQEQLCLGAPTARGPVDCYLRASRELMLTDDEAIVLCRCSESAEPVTCWDRLRRQSNITNNQITALCAPTIALGLIGNCRPVGYY